MKVLTENRSKVIGADPDFKRSGDEVMCPRCGIHFQSFSPSLAVICPSCKVEGFQFPDHVPTCEDCGTRGLCFVIDGVHRKYWVSWRPEVMQKYREQTDDFEDTGNSERARRHWKELSEWIDRKPRTIRYMTREELASLRKEIIDTLLSQGTTRERAEALAAGLPIVGVHQQAGGEHESDVEVETSAQGSTSSTKTCMPHISENGDLIIPHNCPPKYRWWDSGQSIAETRAELAKHCKK